jgi:hypothetical protein
VFSSLLLIMYSSNTSGCLTVFHHQTVLWVWSEYRQVLCFHWLETYQ